MLQDAETNQDKLKAVIAHIAKAKQPGKVKLASRTGSR